MLHFSLNIISMSLLRVWNLNGRNSRAVCPTLLRGKWTPIFLKSSRKSYPDHLDTEESYDGLASLFYHAVNSPRDRHILNTELWVLDESIKNEEIPFKFQSPWFINPEFDFSTFLKQVSRVHQCYYYNENIMFLIKLYKYICELSVWFT